MKIVAKTSAKGTHNVKIDGGSLITFSSDGDTKLAGRDVTPAEAVAVVAAVQVHKALCWTKARCVGHDVTAR